MRSDSERAALEDIRHHIALIGQFTRDMEYEGVLRGYDVRLCRDTVSGNHFRGIAPPH